MKNAVAYEAYNYEGKLLRITMYGLGSNDSHSYTQVLFPQSYDMDQNAVYIMAVGYDGTRIKVYESADTQETFRKVFEEYYNQVQDCLTKVDETKTKPGFLSPDAIAEALTTVDELESLIENTPEDERDYRLWYVQIKNVLEELQSNTSARVPITPNGFYTIALSNNANRYFNYATAGLNTSTSTSSISQWKLAPATTEGTYYIQHRETGNYISEITSVQRAKATSNDVSQAIPFKLVADAPGQFFIQTYNTGLNLYNNTTNRVYAGIQNGATAKWTLTLIEAEGTGVITQENPSPRIHAQSGQIVITGLTPGSTIYLYDAMGKQLTSTTATSSTITLQTGLAKGQTAIVVLGTHSEKILMK